MSTRSPRSPRCPECGEAHTAQNTRVVGSYFGPEPYAYRALDVPDAPDRPTREAAIRDRCEYRQRSKDGPR